MHTKIESAQNPKIKFLLQLKEKSRVRRKEQLFSIEGLREISLALQGGYQITQLYFCSEIISYADSVALIPDHKDHITIFEVTKAVYQKLSYRDTTEGIIAIAIPKEHTIASYTLPRKDPLFLIAEGLEKPGNIGALLRTADAAHVDAVCIANPKTDIYNPNIIRSSVGCVFTTPILTGDSASIITFLQQHNVRIYSAALQASAHYYTQDYKGATAIAVGTEATGLTNIWTTNSYQNIKIPMEGSIDSMNVSVAAGILTFEAKRQRDFAI